MKTLLLLRHAKSSRDDPNLEDFDRLLAPRGRAAAPRIGAVMRGRGLLPDLVLCSPARRARQTWDLVAPALGSTPKVRFDKRLYLATDAALLASVRACPAEMETVLVVGHNPGLEEFASLLLKGGPRRDIARLRRKFPTGALAVLRFDIRRWPEVAPQSGDLLLFARPREIDG